MKSALFGALLIVGGIAAQIVATHHSPGFAREAIPGFSQASNRGSVAAPQFAYQREQDDDRSEDQQCPAADPGDVVGGGGPPDRFRGPR
jgi:hypothetical protein